MQVEDGPIFCIQPITFERTLTVTQTRKDFYAPHSLFLVPHLYCSPVDGC